MSVPSRGSHPAELPLVGRSADARELGTLFGPGVPFTLVTGESGVGKTRLLRVLSDEARRRGWQVAHGRAYPVEAGMPYALLSDAFLPLIREFDDATLSVLTRGRAADLRRLFPALGDPDDPGSSAQDPGEIQSRLYWNFTEFLGRLGGRTPLLLVLEDLHFADPSSLSLIHFLARQLDQDSVRVLASYNTDYRDANERIVRLERSLLALGRLRVHPLAPLTRADTDQLLEEMFGVSGPPRAAFGDLLFGWTRGNPFFIEQVLQALVDSGQLYRREGTWLGWESRELALPDSVRDAVLLRLRDLDPGARTVAEVLAVVGGPAPPRLLERVSGLPSDEAARAVEALVGRGLADEEEGPAGVRVDVHHPLARETLYQEIGLIRRQTLHRAVGETLESLAGDRAEDHTDELAYHFSRAGGDEGDGRALHYLVAAGRAALARHADREARNYLEAALDPAAGRSAGGDPGTVARARWSLARARSRLGDFEGARELWISIRDEASHAADRGRVAAAERHLGLVAYWMGRPREALVHYDAAREALGDADHRMAARLDLAAAVALQEMGEPGPARTRVERALALGEALDDAGLMARAHRALALLETWVGAADRARSHGWTAVELSRQSRDEEVAFWARWALAALEGLTGDTDAMARLMDEARVIADDRRSPVFSLWVAELEVELAHARGDWEGALARGERAIRLAESLRQGTLSARLQVWTALVYIGRGDFDRARELVDGAWRIAGAEGDTGRTPDLHAVIPAHIGRASLLLAEGDYAGAMEVGERGLELADRSGYVVWVLHRLLPVVGEAAIRAGRLDIAREAGARMRREGERMGHHLGLAWAAACNAIVAWHGGDVENGAQLLRKAAETLEEIPLVPDAARVRRQLAGRLADLGDREGALVELRRVHEVFTRLGAEPELRKAREQFRELDARPPARGGGEGAAGLTGRELEIARLVADRMSSKAMARALDISPRTVTTHLSNIYRKLEVSSREALADLVREGRLPVDPAPPPSPTE